MRQGNFLSGGFFRNATNANKFPSTELEVVKPPQNGWEVLFVCLFVCFGIFEIIRITLEADKKSWT